MGELNNELAKGVKVEDLEGERCKKIEEDILIQTNSLSLKENIVNLINDQGVDV